jgi:hypothetical protein
MMRTVKSVTIAKVSLQPGDGSIIVEFVVSQLFTHFVALSDSEQL